MARHMENGGLAKIALWQGGQPTDVNGQPTALGRSPRVALWRCRGSGAGQFCVFFASDCVCCMHLYMRSASRRVCQSSGTTNWGRSSTTTLLANFHPALVPWALGAKPGWTALVGTAGKWIGPRLQTPMGTAAERRNEERRGRPTAMRSTQGGCCRGWISGQRSWGRVGTACTART